MEDKLKKKRTGTRYKLILKKVLLILWLRTHLQLVPRIQNSDPYPQDPSPDLRLLPRTHQSISQPPDSDTALQPRSLIPKDPDTIHPPSHPGVQTQATLSQAQEIPAFRPSQNTVL